VHAIREDTADAAQWFIGRFKQTEAGKAGNQIKKSDRTVAPQANRG
jgi:hypothetical protein